MSDEQYARAVRRAKRIIVGAVLAVVLALAAACAALAVTGWRAGRQLDQLEERLGQMEQELGRLEQQAAQPQGDELESEKTPLPDLAYQALYPELAVEPAEMDIPADGTVYLTFDDGPSANTPALLDALDELGVKATFFVVGAQVDRYPEYLQMIVDRGHAIGVHSDCHEYKTIYRSVDAFLQDFAAVAGKVKEVTGQTVAMLRFPGGSINGYDRGIYQPLIAEVVRRGYVYHDWNVSAEDASSQHKSAAQITETVCAQVRTHDYSVVLLHDAAGRQTTIEAVRRFVPALQQEGYTFAALDAGVKPIIFAYTE